MNVPYDTTISSYLRQVISGWVPLVALAAVSLLGLRAPVALAQPAIQISPDELRARINDIQTLLGQLEAKLPAPGPNITPWSLTSLRDKLINIGAKVVSHGRYVTFQMAEVAVPRQMFQEILHLIARLRAPLAPA